MHARVILARIWPLLPAVALAFAACSSTPPSGAVLFQDDFSAPGGRWSEQSDVEASTAYLDGEFQIAVHVPQLTVWSVAGQQFGDVVVQVEARTAGGPEDNAFGIICRFQDDENLYFMLISADGYYGIGSVIAREFKFMHGEADVMKYSEDVPTGLVSSLISGSCIGDTLTLAVNGRELATATATEFQRGDVGLVAKSYLEPEVDVRFDNLVVRQP